MSVVKDIGKGTFYNAIAKYAGVIINLIVTGILARLLSAEDFGVVALTTVVITFFDLLGNMGFGPAIIQNKNLNNHDISSIFNVTVIIAVVLTIFCIVLSPFFAGIYKDAELAKVMQILSLQVLFTILNVVPYSLLLKAKQFRFIASTNVCCNIVLGLLAVICAISGVGIFSLLIAPIGTAFISLIVYTVKSRKLYGGYHSFIFDLQSVNKVLSFSIYQFLFNIVNYFSRNLDKLLIGNRFSMSDLGYYEKSYRLMQLPISNISSVMAPTIQPVLSHYQEHKDELLYYTNLIIKVLSYVGFTLTPLLYFCSKEIILIVFGENWLPAVPIFQILSLSVFAQVVDSATGSLLQASNSPKLLFFSGLMCSVINVICIVIGVFCFKSLVSLAWILSVAFILNLILDLYFIYKLSLHAEYRNVISVFKQPIIVSIIISFSLFIITRIPINSSILMFVICSLVTVGESFFVANRLGLFSMEKIKKILKQR